MKITSASKKVLASALSAAMVVAFAPTVAFGAISGSTDTSKWTDDDFIAAGAIAKKTWVDSEIHNQYFFSADELSKNMQASYKLVELKAGDSVAGKTYVNLDYSSKTFTGAGSTVGAGEGGSYYEQTAATASGTIKLLKDVKAAQDGSTGYALNVVATPTTSEYLTLDLDGHTLSTKADENKGSFDLINVTSGNFYVKNGTLSATDNKTGDTVNAVYEAVAGAAATFEDVTADQVDGVTLAKKTVKLGDVTNAVVVDKNAVVETGSIGGTATVAEGASLTAAAENAGGTATAITGKVTVTGKNATVTATANGKGNAIAIAGGVQAFADANTNGVLDGAETLYKGVKVVAKAKSTTDDATAIKGDSTKGTIAAETIEATADAAAAGKKAFGVITAAITGDGSAATPYTVAQGSIDTASATVSASGSTSDLSFAIGADKANIAGGNVDGKLVVKTRSITGGSYTDDPSKLILNNTDYDVTYAGGVYTVSKFKSFAIDNTQTNNGVGEVGEIFLQGALQAIATGNTVSGLTFAEGWDAQKMLAFATGEGAGKLSVKFDVKDYSEKTATDEQKAAKAAIEEAVKGELLYTKDEAFKTIKVTVQYTKQGAFEPTVIATVTDLGTMTVGMQSKDNTYDVTNGVINGDSATAWQYINGKAEKVAFKDANKNGKHESTETTVSLRYIPVLITSANIDQEAVKDAAGKGEQAVEKATQGIDVSQKSRTVKLAKGKTKTAKALYFKMGASAETALTTAKKSGSSRITVSGDKVTLKKGTKKGTYTAKVSLKAAGSAEYLAAAKTITVKFVVKK